MAVMEERIPTGGKAPSPTTDDTLLVATQWQLIRWKFLRHRVAVAALAVIVLFYLAA
ncbi:MAG: hypothetical protein KDE58_13140, partial [Caldilineaceae bacterium]|nr:hypothetical protein [Caldilineaceae bacterium]